MNSRRLTVITIRTAAFLVVGILVFTTIGWSWFAGVAVGLIAAAMTVQLGGVLWLRHQEATTPHASTGDRAHQHGHGH